MLLIYCYDAWCGWCYGFSDVMKKVAVAYADKLPIEVLSGGMILPDTARPISVMAPFIQQAYKTVEEYTGVKFGEDFLWHVFNPQSSDWFPHSEKPAVALSVLKKYYPNRALEFATDLQYALNFEGRDLTDDEAYRHLLPKYELDADTFYTDLHSDEFREAAHYDFALVKQLNVTSFPQLLLQVDSGKFYLLAKGYTDFDTLQNRIESVIADMNK